MDEATIEEATKHIRAITADHDIPIDRLIVFGSRVREDYREQSDIDILLVSTAFEGVTYYKRPRPFNKGWDYDELPPPELIPLTPSEFDEKRRKRPHIVRTAVEEGVSIA